MGCGTSNGRHLNDPAGAAQETQEGSPGIADPDDGQDGDNYVSVLEGMTYLKQELELAGSRAEQLAQTVEANDEGMLSSVELVYLGQKIKQIKHRMEWKFRACDPENSGFVEPGDAVRVLCHEFPSLPLGYLKSVLIHFDTDNNNKVDFYEFIQFYASIKAKKRDLEEKFRELDSDGSGDLDPDELCATLIEECAIEAFQARSLVDDFDVNKDGNIGIQEFMELWTSLFG